MWDMKVPLKVSSLVSFTWEKGPILLEEGSYIIRGSYILEGPILLEGHILLEVPPYLYFLIK